MKKHYLYSIMLLLFVFLIAFSGTTYAASKTLYLHYEDIAIPILQDKQIRRIVPNQAGTHLYILAHDANLNPTLIAYNHTDGSYTTLTSGVSKRTTGDVIDESTIGNIAITDDGILVGCTQSLVPYDVVGGLYLQYWNNDANGVAQGKSKIEPDWDQDGTKNFVNPLPKNYQGNFNNSRCGEAFSWSGAFNDSYCYFSARNTNTSSVSTYRLRFVRVGMQTGNMKYTGTNGTGPAYGGTGTEEQHRDISLTAYPINTNYQIYFVIKANGINLAEFKIGDSGAIPTVTDLSGTSANMGVQTPIFYSQNATSTFYMVGATSTGVTLRDVSSRVPSAEDVTLTMPSLKENTNLANTAAAGCFVGSNMCLFVVRDGNISKFSEQNPPTLTASAANVTLIGKQGAYADVTITGKNLSSDIVMTCDPASSSYVQVQQLNWNARTGGTLRLTLTGTTFGTQRGTITLKTNEDALTPLQIRYEATVADHFVLPAPVLTHQGATVAKKAALSWNAVADATGYEIEYHNGTKWVAATPASVTTTSAACTMSANAFTARVRAYNATGVSEWSNSVTVNYYDNTTGFTLHKHYEDVSIAALSGKTIKRVVPSKDGRYLYILAHATTTTEAYTYDSKTTKYKEPTLIAYDHVTREYYTLKSSYTRRSPYRAATSGNDSNGKTADVSVIGNIDVTADGYLVACTESAVDFLNKDGLELQYWEDADNDGKLDMQSKSMSKSGKTKFTTPLPAKYQGNFAHSHCGEAFAWKGTLSDGRFYFSARNYNSSGDTDTRWVRVGASCESVPIEQGYTSEIPSLSEEQLSMIFAKPSKSTKYSITAYPKMFITTYPGEKDILTFDIFAKAPGLDFTQMTLQHAWNVEIGSSQAIIESTSGLSKADSWHTPFFVYNDKHYIVGNTSTGVSVGHVSKMTANSGNISITPVTLDAPALDSNTTTNIAAVGTAVGNHLALFVIRDGKISKLSTEKLEQETNAEDYDYVFTSESGTNWWTTNAPKPTHKVKIAANCTITGEAHAEQIDIEKGTTLTIASTGKLTVQRDIRVTADGKVFTPPTAEDLIIKADPQTGQPGSLAYFGKLGQIGATVELYGIYEPDANNNHQWQYITSPFTVQNVMGTDFYGCSWIKWWNEIDNTWVYITGHGQNLDPWNGYLLLSTERAKRHIMRGTLEKNTSKKIDFVHSAETPSHSRFVGNSWMAPLQIAAFKKSDFTNLEQTVYLYSYQGTLPEYTSPTEVPSPQITPKGCYYAIPIENANAVYSPAVINPLQGFFVRVGADNVTSASLLLDYERLVSNGAQPERNKLYAQGRDVAEQEISTLNITVTADDGYYSKVFLFEAEHYTEGYDNGADAYKLRDAQGIPYLSAVSTAGDMAVLATPSINGTYLNFEKGSGTEHTFAFTYDGTDDLWLEDLVEQTETKISTGNTYTFTATADDSSRFRIMRAAESNDMTTEVPNVWINEQTLYVTNPSNLRTDVRIFSAAGQLIEQTTTYDSHYMLRMPASGVYVIEVRNANGVRTIKHIL